MACESPGSPGTAFAGNHRAFDRKHFRGSGVPIRFRAQGTFQRFRGHIPKRLAAILWSLCGYAINQRILGVFTMDSKIIERIMVGAGGQPWIVPVTGITSTTRPRLA
jgi:hypothetical protein